MRVASVLDHSLFVPSNRVSSPGDSGGAVSYTHLLHAAIVEIVAKERAEVKYSTVQNWYPGDKEGKGGIYNFVTKRGLCKGCLLYTSFSDKKIVFV